MASHFAVLIISAYVLQLALAFPNLNREMMTRQSEDTTITSPIPPTQDPFYSPTEHYKSANPGTVLRIRKAPGNLTSLLGANCSAAYNIVYRTTNSHYKADWAVTTVFAPRNPIAALLSYQVPYDSAFLDASPSYALYGSGGASWLADISTGLARGWFVSVPDYEGPLASFNAGVQSGHATIDSIRAALGAGDEVGLDPDAPAALWGYSGGALASEWAAELQVQYAPGLNLRGAALGGVTPNITSILLYINGGISAGLIPPAILGLTTQHPELDKLVRSRLKTEGPYNATGFLAALNFTSDESIIYYAYQDIGDYFQNGLLDLLGPVARKVMTVDGMMGYHGVPKIHLYVYQAINDEIVPINTTDTLVDRYCGGKSAARVGYRVWNHPAGGRDGTHISNDADSTL